MKHSGRQFDDEGWLRGYTLLKEGCTCFEEDQDHTRSALWGHDPIQKSFEEEIVNRDLFLKLTKETREVIETLLFTPEEILKSFRRGGCGIPKNLILYLAQETHIRRPRLYRCAREIKRFLRRRVEYDY